MKLKKVITTLIASAMILSSLATVNAQPVQTGYTAPTAGFVTDSKLPIDLVGRFDAGQVNFDGGVMEIISYNYQNGYAYAVNGVSGNIAIININAITSENYVELTGKEFDVKTAVETKDTSFVYGDMTSISVLKDSNKLAVSLQADAHDEQGRVAIFTCEENGDLTLNDIITVGVQPDMVKFVDENTILTADEAEPKVIDGTYVDPKGSVSIIDLQTKTATIAGFETFDSDETRATLLEQGVMFKKDAKASVDFEPEYITVVGDKAYVSLQEANAVAVVDIKGKKVENVFGLGFIDLGKVAFDINDDDEVYAPELHEGILSVRMPDALDSYQVDGKTYIVTANEGDGREYGDEDEDGFYCNEIKVKFSKGSDSPNGNMTASEYADHGKVLFINPETVDVKGSDEFDFMYGGRGFTIFEVTDSGLNVAFEVGNEIEALTAKYLPTEYFNCSNDNNKAEDRSGKKGSEAESIIVGEVDGTPYAFVALERVSGIMAYDISNPTDAKFVNYINTRDFDDVLGNPAETSEVEDYVDPEGRFDYDGDELDHYVTKGDIAPEGLDFISSENSPNGYPMLLTSNEVSGTVTALKLGNTKYVAPEEEKDDTSSQEISSEEVSSEEVSSQESSSEQTNSQTTSSQEISSEETSSDEVSSQETNSEETSSQESNSEETSSQKVESNNGEYPATGSESSMFAVITTLIVSAMGVVVVALKRKKAKQ